MASKIQNRNLLKGKNAKHSFRLHQDELPDEIALRDEILQLKRQIMLLRRANERNLVKVRKFEDEAKRKDKQIEQLMDPAKNGDVRKLLSTKGAVLLMNLKEQNNALVQIVLDKDLHIKRLLAEIKTWKLYAKRTRPECYRIEIDRLRNLLLKSQTVVKEAQDASRGTATGAGEFSTPEMHLSSDRSTPGELEELQETVRSLEKHMKHSNDLIAKKNEQIMRLMDHLSAAATNANGCGACRENLAPRSKTGSDVGLRDFFEKHPSRRRREKEDIFRHGDDDDDDDDDDYDATTPKMRHPCGQTRLHSAPTEAPDKVFSFSNKQMERLTNSATERKAKGLGHKGADDFSDSEERLRKAYLTEEHFTKGRASKSDGSGTRRTGFDPSNAVGKDRGDESPQKDATDNFDGERNRSDIQHAKKASFDEFDSAGEMEKGETRYPIRVSVFSTRDIVLTHKTRKFSEDAKRFVGDATDEFDMETDEFEAIENEIENEIELGSLLKGEAREGEAKPSNESNAESQIIKLSESAAESQRTENAGDECAKTARTRELFETIENASAPEMISGERLEEQHHEEETKAKEQDQDRTAPEEERSRSEATTECFSNRDRKEDAASYLKRHEEGSLETEMGAPQSDPEKNESAEEPRKWLAHNRKTGFRQGEYVFQGDGTGSRDWAAREGGAKIGGAGNSLNTKFDKNSVSERVNDHWHTGTGNEVTSLGACCDEDDEDVVVGLPR